MTDSGRWEPIIRQVWDTIVTPCDCCGQVVATRLWVLAIAGERRQFCEPACETLYRSHVLPRRLRTAPE